MPSTLTAQTRILLVEDDVAVLAAYRHAFEACEPLTAADGVAAQALLSTHHVDVVVCDLDMPRMGGLELMHWGKEHWPHVEWIVISGEATMEAAIQALKLGAFDFICKPVLSFVQLRTAVANAARQRSLVQALDARNAVEAGLRERERQFRELVENLPELTWSASGDGHIDFYNQR